MWVSMIFLLDRDVGDSFEMSVTVFALFIEVICDISNLSPKSMWSAILNSIILERFKRIHNGFQFGGLNQFILRLAYYRLFFWRYLFKYNEVYSWSRIIIAR